MNSLLLAADPFGNRLERTSIDQRGNLHAIVLDPFPPSAVLGSRCAQRGRRRARPIRAQEVAFTPARHPPLSRDQWPPFPERGVCAPIPRSRDRAGHPGRDPRWGHIGLWNLLALERRRRATSRRGPVEEPDVPGEGRAPQRVRPGALHIPRGPGDRADPPRGDAGRGPLLGPWARAPDPLRGGGWADLSLLLR